VELTDSRQELNRLRLASSFNDENEMLQNRLQELDDDVHRKDDVIQVSACRSDSGQVWGYLEVTTSPQNF